MARMLVLFGLLGWLINTVHTRKIKPNDFMAFPIRRCNVPAEIRYQNLFYTEAEIKKLTMTRDIDDFYEMDKVKVQYPFPNVCDNPYPMMALPLQASNKNELRIPTCNDGEGNMRHRPSPGMKWLERSNCCETKMIVTIPSTVKSMLTGETLNVKHSAYSYQFIHEAQCVSPNSGCLMGICKLANRVHWVLVEQSNGQDMFVPVSVGNHCFCA